MNPIELVFKTMKESSDALKAGEIAELTGLDKKSVDKAMKSLRDEGKIISPKRCYRVPK
jgi:hypothetical protein